jgi:hypothetical protein
MKLLELFSGTRSIGKVASGDFDFEVISLDRDLEADIKKDIMDWDYTEYEPGYFDIITASPVCLWWSHLRKSWVGRKCKSIHPTDIITHEILQEDIDKLGKPMIDKVIEIIEYFKPMYWWIENPQTGRMKDYIASKYPNYNTYYDVDYCQYSDWGYKKRTRIWTNIKNFKPKLCHKECPYIKNGRHLKHAQGAGTSKKRGHTNQGGTTKLERYRLPPQLIKELILCI